MRDFLAFAKMTAESIILASWSEVCMNSFKRIGTRKFAINRLIDVVHLHRGTVYIGDEYGRKRGGYQFQGVR